MVTRYKTITNQAESLFKEKASKFIGLAFPVADETQAKKILDETRKKYFDSRHVCYAYVLGPEKSFYKLSDAGEPANTAGKPILGQIRAFDLTNVLVIVVRYFGGTKLGVGGLIQAYKQSAFDTLQKTTMVEQEVKKTYNLLYTYENMSKVMKEVKKHQADITANVQQEQCRLTVEISLEQEQNFVQAVQLMVIEITPL